MDHTPKMPDFSRYQDRGIMKWQGFFLSEHIAALAKMDKEAAEYFEPRPQMSLEEIGEVLAQAMMFSSPVSIQENIADLDGKFDRDTAGFLLGFDDDSIYIGADVINIEEIRNIKLVNFKKWSDLS